MTDAPMIDPVPTPTPTKPGWKTSEFYGSWAVKILGALMTTGVLGDGTTASRIVGGALVVLGLLGYTASRTMVKAAAALLLVVLFSVPQLACSNSGARAKYAGGEALGCAAPLVVQLGVQLKPAFMVALAGAVSGDGLHVDRAKLKSIAAPLATPALRCAFDSAVVYFLAPVPEQPGVAVQAVSRTAPNALGSTWVTVRSELGWGVADASQAQ